MSKALGTLADLLDAVLLFGCVIGATAIVTAVVAVPVVLLT